MAHTTDSHPTTREVVRIVPAASVVEGGGFVANRPFPSPSASWFDPFLLLDEVGPREIVPGAAVGAPPHPHRGFETVTYVVSGEVEHRDSVGNHGVIGAGDVQWMTAGDGIVHSEMPSARVQTEGGVGHGLQLWVNLPAAMKRTTPSYQGLRASDMASTGGEGWAAEVVAGAVFGVVGPAHTHTPITFARVTVQPGTQVRVPVADGHTALVYAFAGMASIGAENEQLAARHLAVLDRSTGDIVLDVPADATEAFDCLLLTGEPIDEPMVRQGPFVMNTSSEIEEAIADYHAGRMGSIAATGAA